ncbi:MAG: hypothetical protein J6P17_03625 [Acidaminococcaceae bacterium]|nr:hypothetical protein [Acidaminococcaceae bacterium]
MTQNKRELVEAALHNKPVDRVPVGFWFHFLEDQRNTDAVSDPALEEQNLAGHKRFIESWHPDFVKIMTDGFFQYPNPAVAKPIQSIKESADIRPLGKDSPWFIRQVAFAKKLSDAYGKDIKLFYNLFAPPRTLNFVQAKAGGQDDLTVFLKEDPATLKKVLDVIAVDYAALAEALIRDGGVDGIYLSVNNINKDTVAEADYQAYVAPSEIAVLEGANRANPENILHICGYEGVLNHLEWYKDYPFLAVNWAAHLEGVSLAEGKKLFGGRAVIGGFGQTDKDVIYVGTKAEIEQETERLLREAGTVGVILGADCTVPRDIDVQRFNWVRDKAASFS